MVDFAGWSMPVQYTSIVTEHQATRRSAGVFDISHMGRFRFDGPAAAAFLDRILTRRVTDMSHGQVRYALVANTNGGIMDDVLVYHLRESSGTACYWMVVNAGNRQKIAEWIKTYLVSAEGVKWNDCSESTAMIAVQGPHAHRIVNPLVEMDTKNLAYYTGKISRLSQQWAIVSRTGYTGEDGIELIIPAEIAANAWQTILSAGGEFGAIAAGLGARDTLRLEAAMPLYGHELSEDINPFQAGLRFAVNLKNRDFVGRDALVRLRTDARAPRRVGLESTGKRLARQHDSIQANGQTIGQVTSGTYSPTLQKPIAMGYVAAEVSEVGSKLDIEVRGRLTPARVVQLPFYKRSSEP